MFCSEDEPFHPSLNRGPRDLVSVEVGGIEDTFALVAVAPFLVRERVHGEVEKAVKFHVVPMQLSGAGHRPAGRGWTGGSAAGQQRSDGQAECQFHDSILRLGLHFAARTRSGKVARMSSDAAPTRMS